MTPNEIDQIRVEIGKVLDRYSAESDVTVYQLIGMFEVIKTEFIEKLPRLNSETP